MNSPNITLKLTIVVHLFEIKNNSSISHRSFSQRFRSLCVLEFFNCKHCFDESGANVDDNRLFDDEIDDVEFGIAIRLDNDVVGGRN